jgi:multidrug efflux pump
MVEDRGDVGARTLQAQTEKLVEATKKVRNPDTGQDAFVGLTSVFRANVPQLYIDVDRIAAMTKQVSVGSLFDTMRVYLGSLYVNDINLYGRTWRVTVQAEPKYRDDVEDIARLKVRNYQGNMVSLGAVANVNMINNPQVLTRYNMYHAAPINGASAPGTSSGEGIAIMQDMADRELLRTMATEWTELAYLEIQAGSTAMIIFGFAVVMVFLVLAAQYESWSLPLAIILVVPMCLLSAIIGVQIAKQDINIFTQIGFVVLVGLASKNAILIVEFAKQRREEGETPRQAALDACLLRLRPIIMTSLAFILGVLPLMVSHGAGAEMRRTLGVTVFSGMVGVTIFGIFLTPVFFYVIDVLGETALFRSRTVRLASKAVLILLNFVTFGVVTVPMWIIRQVRRELQRPSRRPAVPHKLPAPHDSELPEPAEAHELVEQK